MAVTPTPLEGVRAVRLTPPQAQPNIVTQELPAHLTSWQLPPDWRWGSEGVRQEHRHYQEIVDALGRSLALVTAPDPTHQAWLAKEARHLAHRNHSSIPTTYHYWSVYGQARRGPGYLRRWLVAETSGSRVRRVGREPIPTVLHLLRTVGSGVPPQRRRRPRRGSAPPAQAVTADCLGSADAGARAFRRRIEP